MGAEGMVNDEGGRVNDEGYVRKVGERSKRGVGSEKGLPVILCELEGML